MTDLRPMVFMVCDECREGRGALTTETELCRTAGCFFFERCGPVQPIRPTRTREEMVEATENALSHWAARCAALLD